LSSMTFLRWVCLTRSRPHSATAKGQLGDPSLLGSAKSELTEALGRVGVSLGGVIDSNTLKEW
jgi:hypothetical protein